MNVYRKMSEDAATLLAIRRFVFVLLAVSVLTNALFALWLLTHKDETRTVVLTPRETVSYIAASDTVSANLLERFGLEALELVLNVTPASADYQTGLFLKHVASESYAAIAENLHEGAKALKRNAASSAFFPLATSVEADAKRVCVRGERHTLIGKAVTSVAPLNVCLRFTVRSGRLWIVQLEEEPEAPPSNKH